MFIPNNTYHIFNQGNNEQTLFFNDEDYLCLLRLLKKNIFPFCEIMEYCIMPNHFHLMIDTDSRCSEKVKHGGLLIDLVINGISKLLSSCVRISNKKYDKTGNVVRQKKSSCISSDELKYIKSNNYHFIRSNYIHLNP
jgi:putative transposase